MSFVKKGVKPVERSYGDFIVSFTYLSKCGGFITIRGKNNEIDPTTFHLVHGKLESEPGVEISKSCIYSTLIKKAASKGSNIENIGEECFEDGISETIGSLIADLKKRHPKKYKEILE